MTITTVTSGLYRIQLLVPLSDSTHGTMTHFEIITVRLRDHDGTEGVGYTYTTGAGGAAVHALIEQGLRHVIAEFAVLTGQETLAALDPDWFAAARQALQDGAIAELGLVANDQCFRITRRSRWKFWRRRRAWLENLARRTETP